MAYKHLINDVNFNFQINRILTYGSAACNEDEKDHYIPLTHYYRLQKK